MHYLADFNVTPEQSVIRPILDFSIGIGTLLLSGLLTAKAKRIIYSTSLYVHIMRIDVDNIDKATTAKELNDIDSLLNLVHAEENALMVPFLLHDKIWGKANIPTVSELKETDPDFESIYILNKTPRWLKYNSNEMRHDTLAIIRKLVGATGHLRRKGDASAMA